MATLVGRVGMVMKGTWSNSATYEVLDAVSYNSETYIAKQAVPANTLPTNTTYWQKALGFDTENYATTGIGLEYSSAGSTPPTYSINGQSNISRSGNVINMFLWFQITDVGSGSGLKITGLPVVPNIGRYLCQMGGSSFGAASEGVIDRNSTSIIVHNPDGSDARSNTITTGNMWLGVSFAI